ncbi:transglycosylase SLT domain protein [Veillonellaceae bacterium DNF00626]|nr:transglycosylase SLT domain protein [Veillonellaceae bacterium DNF00626]
MDLDRFFRRKDRDGFDTTPVVYIQGYDELKDTTPQEAGTSESQSGGGFLDKAENTAIWGLKHLWNGAKAIPRNFGEFVTMLAQPRAQGIMNDPEMREVAKYAPDAPDTLQNAVRQAREDLMNNEYLKPTKVEDNTLLAKFGGALIENGPQYLLMAPLGPYAGAIAMGGLAAGSTYESARQEQHMTDDQAIKAGLTDAPFEMALEHLGMKGTVLKSLGKGIGRATKSTRFADLGAKLNARLGKAGGWLEPGDPLQKRNVLRAAVEGFASEAPTEFAQQYAQQLSTDVYDPKVSKAQMLYNVTTNPKTFNDALFAGAVGGVMGGGMGAALTPLHNRAIDKITAKTGTSYNSSVDNVLAQSKAGQEQAKIYDDVMAKREAQKKLEQRAEIQKAEAAEQEQRAQVAQQAQNAMPLGYEEFSDEIKQAINDNATKDVPPALIAAIIQQESGGDKTVVSYAGAQGLMQLMPGTAEEMKVANPFDVDDNVRGGVAYYTKLKKMFGGNDVVALAAYNAGDGYVQKWIKNGIWDGTLEHADQIPFAQTRDYVKNVMSNWQGSISNGVYVNAGATPAEQMALIQSQNERDAAIREAYNQVANSQMAKDFALDLARTSTDPKVVNEVNRAVKLKDDKKLEEIARANGYVDEDLTPMPKKDTGNVFTTHNQAGAAQGNINTNDRVNISSMEENGGRPPIIAVDRKSMAAPTEMTVNDEANIVSDRIARALVGDTKNGNIAPISKQNVNNDTFIIKNGNGANSAVDTNISATVNTQPTGATVSGIQDVTNTLNSGDLPTAEQSAAAINELQDAPQSQERDDLISALAKNINGESVAAPSQERTNQAVRTVAEPTVEPTATKEEALFTPTAQPRADAQDRLNEAVQKLQRRELPTKEESQAILADLAHLPDSDGVRQSRAIFEGIVRRDFSMFGKNNQAQMEALAAKEDAERRAAQESAASKTSISLVDGAVSSNKAVNNLTGEAVNYKTTTGEGNPTGQVIRNMPVGTEGENTQNVKSGQNAEIKGEHQNSFVSGSQYKRGEASNELTYSDGNEVRHQYGESDNSLVGIQKKTHSLATGLKTDSAQYGTKVKENKKNGSLSVSVQVGNKSNHLRILGVLKPNDNGGDVVFQFKDNSKKVGEIKFSLRDFCEYSDVGGNVHVSINKNLQTIFYNSDFFKTHFETPHGERDKGNVLYKNDNKQPPRADFFVDGMKSAFKDLITVYDNKHYKGETLAEGSKAVDNKEKKNTEINEREGINLDDGRRIDVAKVGEVDRGTRKTETNDGRRGIGNDKSVDEETQKQFDDSGTESIQRLDGRRGSGNISDNEITKTGKQHDDVNINEEPRLVEGTDYLHNVPKEEQGNIDNSKVKGNSETKEDNQKQSTEIKKSEGKGSITGSFVVKDRRTYKKGENKNSEDKSDSTQKKSTAGDVKITVGDVGDVFAKLTEQTGNRHLEQCKRDAEIIDLMVKDKNLSADEKAVLEQILLKGLDNIQKNYQKVIDECKDVYKKFTNVDRYLNYKPEGIAYIEAPDDPINPIHWDRRRRISNNEWWYCDFFKKYGKTPTKRDMYDIAYDEYVEECERFLANPDITEEEKNQVTYELDQVKKAKKTWETLEFSMLDEYIKNIDPDDVKARRMMSEEAYQKIYLPAVKKLGKGTSDLAKSAKEGALIYAKIIDNFSKAYGVSVKDVMPKLKKGKAQKAGEDNLYQRLATHEVDGYTADELAVTATITGDEFGQYKDIKELRTKALTYYKENLQGTFAHNDLLGDIRLGEDAVTKEGEPGDVKMTGKGKKKMSYASDNPFKLLAVTHLKDIIANANIIATSQSQKEKHQGWTFYYLHSAIDTPEGKQYVVVTVADKGKGTVDYYNHRIFTKDEYSTIEKATGETSGKGFAKTPKKSHEVASSVHSIYEADKIYKSDEGNNGKNLVALHNISIKNLGEAIKIGGFPVPSIAITKKQTSYTEFGEITLVMDKNVADPGKERVYTRDAWTTVFPEVIRKPIQKALAPIVKAFDIAARETGLLNHANGTEVVNYWTENNAAKNLENALNSPLGKYVYLKSIGQTPELTYRKNYNGDEVVDEKALNEEITKKLADKTVQEGYRKWKNNLMNQGLDVPKIRMGRRKVPLTLDNLVRAMKGGKQNGQKGIFGGSGIGNVIAAGAKKIGSLKSLHQYADRLLTNKDNAEELYKDVRGRVDALITEIIQYAKHKDVSTFDHLMNAADVLVAVQQKKISLSTALAKYDFDVPSDKLAALQEKVSKVTEDIANLPVNYFEAKPNRAVGFNEVKAAVIPKGTPKKIKDFLESQGIVVKEYDPKQEGHREQVTNEAQESVGMYFQKAYHGSPYTFERFDLGEIGTGEGEQAHGWGLYFAKNREIAKNYRDVLGVNSEEVIIGNVKYKTNEDGDWYNEKTGEVLADTDALDLALTCMSTAGNKADAIEDLQRFKKEMEGKTNEYSVEAVKRATDAIKLLGENESTVNKPKSLFEVEIPENEELLDEQKTFNEQPEKVKDAIRKIMSELYHKTESDYGNLKGKAIYEYIANAMGGKREASEKLNSLGVKGITYKGEKEGRCFVVFDDKAITTINRYNQTVNQSYAGAYNRTENVIHLFEAANQSTLLHEAAHWWLSMLDDMYHDPELQKRAKTDASLRKTLEKVARDRETIRAWGMRSSSATAEYKGTKVEKEFAGYEKDILRNPNNRAAQERYIQERFARGFERYLMTGEAPTKELRGIFRKFKSWLIDLYKTAKSIAKNPANALGLKNPPKEIRDIFDRMVATQEEIDDWIAKKHEGNIYDANIDFSKNEQENIEKWKEDIPKVVKEKAISDLSKQIYNDARADYKKAFVDPDMEKYKKGYNQSEQAAKESLERRMSDKYLRIRKRKDAWGKRTKVYVPRKEGILTKEEIEAIQRTVKKKQNEELREHEKTLWADFDKQITEAYCRNMAECELETPEGEKKLRDMERQAMDEQLRKYARALATARVENGDTGDFKYIAKEEYRKLKERNRDTLKGYSINESEDIKPGNKNAVEANADGDTKGAAADTETQETNTEDDTKYSVAEDEEPIKNTSKDEKTEEEKEAEIREKALKESDEKLKRDQGQWGKQVDKFMEAKTKDSTNEPIFIMDSPVLFDLLGIERLPVKITPTIMNKILMGKHAHPDMIKIIKGLPTALSRPAAVVQNKDGQGKLVDKDKEILIFTEQEIDGKAINVAVHFRKIDGSYFMTIKNAEVRKAFIKREEEKGHHIKTVFPRVSSNRLADAICNGELLYWDKAKGENLYSNSTKKEISNTKVPANLNADSYSNDISSFDNNLSNEEGDTSLAAATNLTVAASLPLNKSAESVRTSPSLSDHNISDKNRNVKSDTTQGYSKMRKENPEGYLAAMKAQIGEDVYTEKDLDNLIVEAYKENHETRYQGTTIQSETKAYTLSDVKTSFKGQDVKQVGKNGFEVTLKNGNKVTITQTGEITRSDGKKIRGKYIKGNITLTNLANAFTLDHEIFHFAKDCLYTQKEWAFIEKKVRALLVREGNKNPTADEIEDRAADWYADWKYKRAHPSGVMQKLFHMVYDFVSRVTDLVHKNVNTRFSNLANGDLFERQMTDNHGNTMKYSTVEETNDAVEKTTKDIAEDTEHGFNMFTKAVSALKNFNKNDGRYNNITVEMNTNSFNWIKYGVMNPDHLAKNNETLKVFTDLGKNSMRELQHLRNDTEEKLNKIAKAIEGKDKNGNVRRELYDRIMEEGELNGEEYTREELVAEGIDKGVIDAYLETRKMYNDFYKMVDATKRGVETFHKTVSINGVEALRRDRFVENLNVKPLANGRYEVTFGMAKKYPHFGEKVAGADLKELLSSNYAKVNDIRDKDGVAVKIESTDDIKDEETYSVDYITVPKPLSNIKGYFHHFFENWMVYEKVTDESGAVSYVPVGSYRSRREALQAFKKLDDLLHEDKKYTREELEVKGIDRNVIDTYMSTMMDNPAIGAHEYVIRPKEFHMPMNGGVALGDVKFEQAMRAIEAKYEVNEDEARKLAKGILKKKVGHRFLGATVHRTGQKGYSTDMLHVLHMYTTKATRYIALESFKNKAYRAFERFFGVPVDESKKGGLQQYIKKYIEDMNGNPTRIEEMFNELINNLTGGKLAKWFGTDRPFMSWSNTVMAYSAVLKLGLFNISSAAINLTQLTNAVTLLGIKPFLKAHWITGRFTDEERKFLKDVGVETQLGLDSGAGYDKNRMTSIQNKLINYSLFTFTWSEQKVRQITALMAFAEAKRRGMSYEEAVEFAQSVNDDANFDYGINNAPLFIRAGGPVTQMMFQFMKFPVNQIAFMTDIIRHGTNGQRARLMIPLACAGVYGVPFWAAVICPALAAAVAGAAGDDYDDPELYLKKKCYEWAGDDPFWQGFLDVAFYGLPVKFGVNIGRRMGVGDFGGDVSKSLRGGKYGYDLGDLRLSLLGGVMFSSIKQAMTQWGNGNVIEAIKAFSPALGNAAQAVVGERRTTRGRVATRYDDISTRIIKALGFMPIEETKEGEKERILKEERRIKVRNEQRIIDDFIRAKEDGDKKRMHDLIETMRKKGIKPKRVADEIKRKNQTGLERAEDFGKKKQDKKPNTRKRYDGRLKHYSPKRSHEKGNSYDSLYNM